MPLTNMLKKPTTTSTPSATINSESIICFGQQPCGFFPKRYLYAKIKTARRLQQEQGGRIIFFYHDSDQDYRETITVLADRHTAVIERLNFLQENKIQKKYSPLYCKRVPDTWQADIARRLHRFVDPPLIDIFLSQSAQTVADFCLGMYRGMGLLDGIEVVRSSDPAVRQAALDVVDDYYADVEYEGETVRARFQTGALFLEQGGGLHIPLPPQRIQKQQKNPAREQRFAWMQSVIHCNHYVQGESEAAYFSTKPDPTVQFVQRDVIADDELAWIGTR